MSSRFAGRYNERDEAQPVEHAVSDKPKRRWYQFSLKTMLVVLTLVSGGLGAGIAIRSHQQFCWARAVHYIEESVKSVSLDRVFWPNNPNLTAE